jgi:hypothetical protein
MTAPPLICLYDGESFIPKHPKLAERHYTIGETYPLVVHEQRSQATHNHYFASIADAWANLNEDAAERLPTPEALRKWALIKTGYRDERSITCASKAEALRVAAFVKPIDEFALVIPHEAQVTIYVAKSQSLKAMGKVEFQRSKQAVLDLLANMLGTTAGELQANARDAA